MQLSLRWLIVDVFLEVTDIQVVKYCVTRGTHPAFRYPGPLLDAKKGIHLAKPMAKKYQFSPDQVGVIGFSAGGHLVAMAVTQFDDTFDLEKSSTDSLTDISARPVLYQLSYGLHQGTCSLLSSPFFRQGMGKPGQTEKQKPSDSLATSTRTIHAQPTEINCTPLEFLDFILPHIIVPPSCHPLNQNNLFTKSTTTRSPSSFSIS